MSRRGGVAIGILVLWFAGLAMLARRELFQPRTEAFAEAGLRVSPGAVFFTVESGPRVIGYASSTIDTTTGAITINDALDTEQVGSSTLRDATTHIELSRALTMRSVHIDVAGDTLIARMLGDTAMLVISQPKGAAPDTQHVALKGTVIVPVLVPLIVALGEPPKIGKHYTMPLFDPATRASRDVRFTIAAESLFVLVDSARFDSAAKTWVPAHRDTVRAFQITPESDGMPSVPRWTWVDADGHGVEVRQAGGVTLRRTAYEIAFENWRLQHGDSAAIHLPKRP